MAQSLSKIYVHLVFHTKNNAPFINKEIRPYLFESIKEILKTHSCISIAIGGVEDHVHVLFLLSKNYALAKIVEYVKKDSCKWIKSQGIRYKNFAWQGGYASFSINESRIEGAVEYIDNQEVHHKVKSTKEELEQIFIENGLAYDPKYYWDV
jgi:putative transposase